MKLLRRVFILRYLVLNAVFLCIVQSCFAAGTDSLKTWADLYKTFKTDKLQLTWIKPATDTNLIREMEVVDMRPDTGHIGMCFIKMETPFIGWD